ncbi:hypothetical protein [Burkholderia sp. BCC1993]|uniref:hypothetical protein n=1 Tax=Burkholderia sp. BCC1993 TaxID=2817444 RepID=UPI002AB163F5|nr:hypothetical protein [Burkholderia sp. BCC1993]
MKHGTLYKPSAAQIDHLLGLPAHSPAVVAVDNSPVVERELHALLAAHGVDVVANHNRGGIAGAGLQCSITGGRSRASAHMCSRE